MFRNAVFCSFSWQMCSRFTVCIEDSLVSGYVLASLCVFLFPLGDKKNRERNVTAFVFSAVFIVSPLSHFESFPYQQRNGHSPLV